MPCAACIYLEEPPFLLSLLHVSLIAEDMNTDIFIAFSTYSGLLSAKKATIRAISRSNPVAILNQQREHSSEPHYHHEAHKTSIPERGLDLVDRPLLQMVSSYRKQQLEVVRGDGKTLPARKSLRCS